MNFKIAVLITCYNRKVKTLLCLTSLFNNKLNGDYNFDVFLVDDGSTDGTSDAVIEKFPMVNIIKGSGNLFWNQGMRVAWKHASEKYDYDFYLWLNDDTIIKKNAIDSLINTFVEVNEQVIIVGTTCSTNNINEITYGGRNNKIGLIPPCNKYIECDFFNGNIVLIPKQVYKKNGMNDSSFRHALGDFDYGLRAKKNGIKSYIAPGILGECDEHSLLADWCNPNISFKQRWKAFRTPLGQNPEEFFIYKLRHSGLINAILIYFSNHLRVFFPRLWNKRNENKK